MIEFDGFSSGHFHRKPKKKEENILVDEEILIKNIFDQYAKALDRSLIKFTRKFIREHGTEIKEKIIDID